MLVERCSRNNQHALSENQYTYFIWVQYLSQISFLFRTVQLMNGTFDLTKSGYHYWQKGHLSVRILSSKDLTYKSGQTEFCAILNYQEIQ